PSPAVMPLIFSETVLSTRCAASLNAATSRSSSISRSSPTSEGSMLTRFTSYLQVICTFTMPAPDCPSTSSVASCSCMRRMFSCIICACFISCPMLPFMRGSFLRLADGRIDDFAVEQADEVAHEAVGLHGARGFGLARGALARLERRGARARGFPDENLDADSSAEVLLERGLELLLVGPLGEIRLRLRHHELEGVVLARAELGVARELARGSRDGELLHERRPVGRAGGGRCFAGRGRARRPGHRQRRSGRARPEREHAQQ